MSKPSLELIFEDRDRSLRRIRVPGGWLYEAMCCANVAIAFVPEALDPIPKTLDEYTKSLEDLIDHMEVHSGYPNCGYNQMNIEQRTLYDAVIKKASRDIPGLNDG